MVEFKISPVHLVGGVASTLKDAEVRGIYADAVEKFLKDNFSMGKMWQERVLYLLLTPVKTPADNGDLRGSNPYFLAFMQEHIDGLNLITLQELRQVYEQNNLKTPFLGAYVDTGLALIQKSKGYEYNDYLTDILNSDFRKRGIAVSDGRVPNFAQLKVVPDKKSGLVFRLNETATQSNVPILNNYKWDSVGTSGLFRAYLGSDSNLCAFNGNLEISTECGGVVKYDAEGVAPKKLKSSVRIESPIITKRLNDFRNITKRLNDFRNI